MTGARPFNTADPQELAALQQSGLKVKPSDLRPGLAKAVDDALVAALAYDAHKRPASARAFGDALAQALTPQPPPPPRMNKRWLAAAAVAGVLAVCLLAALWWNFASQTQAREQVIDNLIANSPTAAAPLQGGNQLVRAAMDAVLEAGGISTANQRGLHILSRLAQEGFICFGTRAGKQQTFALLDECVPAPRALERDEALAELARRYFTSHGPATLQDFVWWSGLTVADAKAGLAMAQPQLVQAVSGGQSYWLASSMPTAKAASPTAYLLPAYDEYTIAYKDRSAVLSPSHANNPATAFSARRW